MFAGVCESRSTRLSFDIVHLQATPPTCKFLSGLLDVFKGKIGVKYDDPVVVSVRFTYVLKNFLHAAFITNREYAFADLDDSVDESKGNQSFSVLPFGVSIDPVTELMLFCTWPEVAENVVVDSQTYSDFDALHAPVWSIRTRFEPIPVCFMSECVSEFLQHSESGRTLVDLLGEGFHMVVNANEMNPFERLTESKISTLTASVLPSLGSSSSKPVPKPKLDGPLNEEQLMGMLYYMFPDAQSESSHKYNVPSGDSVSKWSTFPDNPPTLPERSLLNSLIPSKSNQRFRTRSSIAWAHCCRYATPISVEFELSLNCGPSSPKRCGIEWNVASKFPGEYR